MFSDLCMRLLSLKQHCFRLVLLKGMKNSHLLVII